MMIKIINYYFQKKEKFFKNSYNERLDKIEELNKKIDYDNLKYSVISTGEEFEFDKPEDPLVFLNDIISLEKAKNLQKDYNEYLNKIRQGDKNEKQKKTLANINVLFNARNNAIKL